MKTKQLISTSFLFALLCCNNIMPAQSIDVNGNPSTQTIISNNLNQKTIGITKSNQVFDSTRALTEINTPTDADAYPYISPDGLRLYFTQSSSFFYASRNSLDSEFSNKQLISSLFQTGSIQGCWLTNNEKEIFYSYSGALYYSSRTSISDPFSTPQRININSSIVGSLYGPSLSPDKQELYLSNNNYPNSYIFRFINSGSLSYTFSDTLKLPQGYIPSPGQLSKDGLKYLLSLKKNSDSLKLYILSRADLNSSFTNLTILDTSFNNPSFLSQSQPSITADEKIIVWVRNKINSWIDDDLYITNSLSTSAGISDITIENSLNIYPNPAINDVTLTNIMLQNVTVSLYSIDGKLLLKKRLDQGNNTIDISGLSKGIYFITSTNVTGVIQKKFIKE
jgi:hypothetical protein